MFMDECRASESFSSGRSSAEPPAPAGWSRGNPLGRRRAIGRKPVPRVAPVRRQPKRGRRPYVSELRPRSFRRAQAAGSRLGTGIRHMGRPRATAGRSSPPIGGGPSYEQLFRSLPAGTKSDHRRRRHSELGRPASRRQNTHRRREPRTTMQPFSARWPSVGPGRVQPLMRILERGGQPRAGGPAAPTRPA